MKKNDRGRNSGRSRFVGLFRCGIIRLLCVRFQRSCKNEAQLGRFFRQSTIQHGRLFHHFVENNLCSLDVSGSEAEIRPLFIGQVCFNESPIDELSIGEWTKSLFGVLLRPTTSELMSWLLAARSAIFAHN